VQGDTEKSVNGWGLLANGSSGRWDVAVDEALDREGTWSAQIEGPQAYVAFQLRDLSVIGDAVAYLQAPRNGSAPGGGERLILGKFGDASVSLIWDHEGVSRCFLVIGPQAGAVVHLTLGPDDITMLIEALRQVAGDLPSHADG
jgi:hypothetical protein